MEDTPGHSKDDCQPFGIPAEEDNTFADLQSIMNTPSLSSVSATQPSTKRELVQDNDDAEGCRRKRLKNVSEPGAPSVSYASSDGKANHPSSALGIPEEARPAMFPAHSQETPMPHNYPVFPRNHDYVRTSSAARDHSLERAKAEFLQFHRSAGDVDDRRRNDDWFTKQVPACKGSDSMDADAQWSVKTSPYQGSSDRTGCDTASVSDWIHFNSELASGETGPVVGGSDSIIPSKLQINENYRNCEVDKQFQIKPSKTLVGNGNLSERFQFNAPRLNIGNPTQPHAKREFVPDDKKDETYWDRRRKNNWSAKVSRMKRKSQQREIEQQLYKVAKENIILRHELEAVKKWIKNMAPTAPKSPVPSVSSGLETSVSSMSSEGSADHSSSSSPLLSISEDEKHPKPSALSGPQMRENHGPTDDRVVMNMKREL